MTGRAWIQIFALMVLVAAPLFLVQYLQQRQALFLAASVAMDLPSGDLLERLREDLHTLSALRPMEAETYRRDFLELAEIGKGRNDLVVAHNAAIIQLSTQLLVNASLALLGGLALAFLVARGIVKRMAALQAESARAAHHEESLHALRNWQTVARALVHELRAPVSPIKLVAGGIVSKRAAMDPASYAKVAEQGGQMILAQVNTIEQMIDSFTRFAKLPQAEPRVANLADFVRDMHEQYKDYAPENLVLVAQVRGGCTWAAIDRPLLQRVVFNIIRNAVNANAEGKVKVVLALGRQGQHARLVLQNDGKAIPPEVVEQLFDPKVSLTRKRNEQGLGLGLMICRKIALDHGGDLALLKNSDGMVAFCLDLPLAKGETVD